MSFLSNFNTLVGILLSSPDLLESYENMISDISRAFLGILLAT